MTAAAAGVRPRRSRVARRRFNVAGVVFIVALALVWEALVRTSAVHLTSLPAPSAVLVAGWNQILDGEMLGNSVHTVVACLTGWIAGCAIGIVLGLWLGLSRITRRLSLSTFDVLRSIPGIVFVPVTILLYGFSIDMEFSIIIWVSVWPVFINTLHGARAVTPIHLDTARTMRLRRLELVRKIILPTSVPLLLVGMRLALSVSLALAVVSEMVGNPEGIGNAIIHYEGALKPDVTFAYVLAVGLIGLLLNWLFGLVIRLTMSRFAGKAETE